MSKTHIHSLCQKLKNDECLILPSDTIYGLASLAYSAKAIENVFKIKERAIDKKLPIHYANLEMLSIDVEITPVLEKLASKFWPGALTIIATKKSNSKLQYLEETVGIRIPNHPLLLEIIATLQEPITMSSANKNGVEPENTFAKIQQALANGSILLDGIEDDKNITKIPSTIIDISKNKLEFIRIGAISEDEILNSISK